ncbi:MAG: DUF192 domain-containing protein [Phycisphaerales bacterium]|nr:DUF192 domain-containing protein [Phycisphaerales bacterium]
MAVVACEEPSRMNVQRTGMAAGGLGRWAVLRAAAAVVMTLALLVFAGVGLSGCEEKAGANVGAVKLGGRKFFLELALDPQTRFRGLSERTVIEPDGGMLFVFPPGQVAVQGFVMRDCPIAIDIVYLDPAGRVLAMYEMKPEPPRDASKGEGTPADANNVTYNARLKQYSSRFPAQFVIELAGGTLKTLNVKEGDLVQFEREEYVRRAR